MNKILFIALLTLVISSCRNSVMPSDRNAYTKSTENCPETLEVTKRLSEIEIPSITIEKKNVGDSMHWIWKSYKKALDSPKINFVVMYKAKYLYGENEDYEKKFVSINMKDTNLSTVINRICCMADFNWSIQLDKDKTPFVLCEPKK